MKNKKYKSLKGRAIIEISWPACYGSGWSYMTSRADFDSALNW